MLFKLSDNHPLATMAPIVNSFFILLGMYCLAPLAVQCQQSDQSLIHPEGVRIDLKKTPERQSVITRYANSFKVDYTVLDGLLIASDLDAYSENKIIRVLHLKDFEELSKVGVPHPARSYEFLYTEPSDLYRYAYSKIRTDIPLPLLDMQFPLFIDGRIIPLSKSSVADRLDRNSIRKIEFLPKYSSEIRGDSTVIYGAIRIIF